MAAVKTREGFSCSPLVRLKVCLSFEEPHTSVTLFRASSSSSKYICIDGKTPPQSRQSLCDQLQRDEGSGLYCCDCNNLFPLGP